MYYREFLLIPSYAVQIMVIYCTFVLFVAKLMLFTAITLSFNVTIFWDCKYSVVGNR